MRVMPASVSVKSAGLSQRLNQFGPRSLEAPHHHFAHSFKQFTPKRQVLVAEAMKRRSIEKNGRSRSACPRMVVPAIRREQPRPTHWLSSSYRFDRDRAVFRSPIFERDRPFGDQIKTICWFAYPEENLTFLKSLERGATCQKLNMMRAHSGEESMRRREILDIIALRLHASPYSARLRASINLARDDCRRRTIT